MERACFTFEIRPGTEAEYKRRHDEIWPAMSTAIQDAGLTNYTLFRQGTQIIGYVECEPDIETAFDSLGSTDVNARWSHYFTDIIISLTDRDGNLCWAEEVWHQD